MSHVNLLDVLSLEDFLFVAHDGLQEAEPALPLFGQPVSHYMKEVRWSERRVTYRYRTCIGAGLS